MDLTKDNDSGWQRLFRRFFSWYFLAGFLLLLAAYFVKYEAAPLLSGHPRIVYLLGVIHSMLTTVSIAIILASIFTFSIESAQFLQYMRRILARIIISRDFMRGLSHANKRQALQYVLKPSQEDVNLYSNIEEYFDDYVDESLHLLENNFKAGGGMNIRMYCPEDETQIRSDITTAWKIYRTEDCFNPLLVGFEDPRSEFLGAEITPPNESRTILTPNDFERRDKVEESGFKWTEHRYNIPETFNKYQYLSVEMRYREYGHDHWQLFTYKALGYVDGLTVNLRCDGDIVIKGNMIFDRDKNYSIRVSDDRKEMRIACHQWIKPGSGFCVLVGNKTTETEEPEQHNTELPPAAAAPDGGADGLHL